MKKVGQRLSIWLDFRTGWRVGDCVLYRVQERGLVDAEDVVHAAGMPWCELGGPELGLAEGGGVEGCVDVDVGGGAVGDEVRAGHDCGGGFVPEREAGVVGAQQGCVGAVGGGGDLADGVLREVLLVGHVSGDGDGGEIGC